MQEDVRTGGQPGHQQKRDRRRWQGSGGWGAVVHAGCLGLLLSTVSFARRAQGGLRGLALVRGIIRELGVRIPGCTARPLAEPRRGTVARLQEEKGLA